MEAPPVETVNPASNGWLEVYNDRLERMNSAEDEALRAHFEAEVNLIKLTLAQMGITPEGTPPGSNGAEITEGEEDPLDPPYEPPGRKPPNDETYGGGGEFSGTFPPVLEPYRDIIMEAAAQTGVPPELLAAQILQESGGDPNAVSINPQMGTTDRGLMQVSEAVFEGLKQTYPEIFGNRSHDEISTDPELAIMAGAYHMKDLYEQFGDWDVALRGYVSGTNGINVNDAHDSSYSPGTDPNYVTLVNQKLAAIEGA
ncbi:hypothetical protein GCM10007276_14330 [Agaricicola taiwanensis]|uniref:Transglycosylase SLT domain-containing protein n=1 Tax=Agaricicola taiwanensis TaxID=591372 RepID=A0A8J2VRM6_9RHOB|nr:transglycosylase SLT domain-containing protein [Agaricicola taiwanensis]GGE38029.1 hypothetical protein GCM10007276_14330 [Agaricicola taiwanensis]